VLRGCAFRELAASQPWLCVFLMEQLARLLSSEFEEAYGQITNSAPSSDCCAML
jgi:hypothetical protein